MSISSEAEILGACTSVTISLVLTLFKPCLHKFPKKIQKLPQNFMRQNDDKKKNSQ